MDSHSINAQLPFVSICTPTFNRRPFIPYMIKCFEKQDYPKEKMEWIILDDGTDKIGDLVSKIPQVKYISSERKMLLGEKRNILNDKTIGDIIIYMDDDDYYPPCRVSHAVDMLLKNPDALCSGSSTMYIYFKSLDKIYQFGPYGPNHSTAATFAFRRALLKDRKYKNSDVISEEKSFLNNYTVPFVQLDPFKSILVFAHDHNSVNKELLLENAHPDYIKETNLKVDQFIEDKDMREFYMIKVEELLKLYQPGRPENKPEVMKKVKEIMDSREKMITIKIGDDSPRSLSIKEIVNILQQQHNHIIQLNELIKGKDIEIDMLNEELKNCCKRT
jgi:glycosyltransferase involved in cell wall biosynthesis